MTYKQVRAAGLADGAEDVAEKVRDEQAAAEEQAAINEEDRPAPDAGAREVASWPVQGWDEAAIQAGAGWSRDIPDGMLGVYYAAYERGANDAHEALRAACAQD